jgi:hypothetical protein
VTGVQGTQGVTGLIGQTGVQGTQGQTGLQGVQGIQGIQGIQGVTGLTGVTGLRGVTGQGVTGVQGQTGQGQQGATGVGLGLKIKSGVVAAGTFAGNPKTAAVTFTTAFPDTQYSITITGSDARNFVYSGKATTGFTIDTQANQALTGEVSWQAITIGEN